MTEETTSTQIETPIGKLSINGKKTAEIIAILSLSLLGVLTYVLWDHKVEAGELSKELKTTLKENQAEQTQNFRALTQAIRDQSKEQKFQTCILSLPQERREVELNNPNSFCNRLIR